MATFYFDIETDEISNKIVAIAYRQIYDNSALPVKGTELIILKAWETSEKEIIEEFLSVSHLDDNKRIFDFIPVGYELRYDFRFLSERIKKLLGKHISLNELLANRPSIDLKPVSVIMNAGKFPNSSWKNAIDFSFQENPRDIVEEKNWDKLLEYIHYVHQEFLKFYQIVWKTLKALKS